MSDGNPPQRPREWILEPETEYRFELDPDATLAIKVRTSEVPGWPSQEKPLCVWPQGEVVQGSF